MAPTYTELLAAVGIAALLAAPIACEAAGASSWASRCLPVVEGNPGAYPVALEQSCEAWNVRQADARGNR